MLMLRGRIAKVALVLLACQLAGCGFSLRGSETVTLAPDLQRIYLTAQNREFSQELRQALIASGVTLVETPAPGVPRLDIPAALVEEQVISVTRDARAGEYELTLSVTFSLRQNDTSLLRDGETTLESRTLSTSRVYLADPNNAAAKTAESELILNEMRRDLSRRLLTVLQSI